MFFFIGQFYRKFMDFIGNMKLKDYISGESTAERAERSEVFSWNPPSFLCLECVQYIKISMLKKDNLDKFYVKNIYFLSIYTII